MPVSSNHDANRQKGRSGIFNVGIYTRLSLEDVKNSKKGSLDESMSIANQRELLTKYAVDKGWHVEKVYTDDGFKGSNFERPGFIEMMNDVEAGVINLILVKDLSRFGRNIEVARYIDIILPMLNCRFVAATEGIDSSLDCDNMLHIRNLFNEHYLKELSKKIKASHRVMAMEGKRVAGRPPYGYMLDPENNHKFIIDTYAADVVRRIYDLRIKNTGYSRIAGILNADGILSPREYEYRQRGRDYPYNMRSVWLTKSVKTILHSETYIGHRIQLKSGTMSYKISKITQKPMDEWVKVENVHEPIIDIETWNAVQVINEKQSKGHNASPPQPRLFRGLLRCPDCGASFTIASSTCYQCVRYQQTASTVCSSHLIKESALIQILLADIKSYAERIKVDENAVFASLMYRLNKEGFSKQNEHADELAHIKLRLSKLEQTQVQIYENRAAGIITKQICSNLLQDSENEKESLTRRLIELQSKQTVYEQRKQSIAQWIELIERYAYVDTIDRNLLMELVEKIEIGKLESVNGKKQQRIRIFYKFVGLLEE